MSDGARASGAARKLAAAAAVSASSTVRTAAAPRAPRPTPRRDTAWRAFVLHRWDWSESSLILDLFTREGGRVAAAAKGAKRPSSNLRSVLLPFQPLQVLLARRAGGDDEPDEIATLRSAEWAGLPSGELLRDEALLPAFYVNELLLKLLPRGDAHPLLFDAYAQLLAALAGARGEAASQAALRAFELTLLEALGWLADLSVVTATQAPLDPSASYALRAEGGLVTASGDAIAGQDWLRMRAALADRAWNELRHACEQAAAAPLRTMLRHALALHLGGGELRTRDVASSLRRLARTR